MTTYNGLAPQDKRQLRSRKMSLLRSTSNFHFLTNNEEIRGEGTKNLQSPLRHWKAHNDVIPCIVPLHEHGCVITNSLDGYHRIWNLDGECLGELPLPNLTEKMKVRGLFHQEAIGWKFILEKIAVTKSHQDIAKRIIQSINGTIIETNPDAKRHGVVGPEDLNAVKYLSHIHFPPKPMHSISRTRTADARDFLRNQVLKELSDLHPTNGNWSHDAAPPPPKSTNELLAEKQKTRKQSKISIQITEKDKNIQNITAKNDFLAINHDTDPDLDGGESVMSSVGNLSLTTGGKGNGAKTKMTSLTTPIKSNRKQGKLSDSTSLSSLHTMLSQTTATVRTRNSHNSSSKSIYPSNTLWSSTTDLNPLQTHAFSETSITTSHQDGLIDAEGHKILRKINKNSDKVEVYGRLLPEVLLRNPHLTTQVKIPTLDSISDSEVSFGNQKEMYQHANKVFEEKKRFSLQQARHVVTLSRINGNIRHVGSMIHLTAPPQHEIILPNLFEEEEEDQNQTGGITFPPLAPLSSPSLIPLPLSRQQSKRASDFGYGSISPVKTLNKEKIAQLIDKVNETAETDIPDRTPSFLIKERAASQRRLLKKMNEKNSSLAPCALYEKKLSLAIKTFSRASLSSPDSNGNSSTSTVTLTTRQLLPSYKMSDVKHFLEIFQKVDEDYSGDLDPDEWCKFFTSINKAVTNQQARAIFIRVDTYNHGYLSISDLIPVIFSNANKETQKLILKYVENEISKRKIIGPDLLTENDLDILFDFYDENDAGFVLVSLVRDRVRAMNLSEGITYEIFETMKDMEDDEMVNLSEFKRIFKSYLMT
jgi:Ca2+-binding EF-hand superfamily protein